MQFLRIQNDNMLFFGKLYLSNSAYLSSYSKALSFNNAFPHKPSDEFDF